MANTLKFGNGQWATGNGTALAYNDENSNFKPLPFDFTRASSGTVVNQSGLIETVGSGIPRIDFLGNTKGALLLEPSRSNSVTNSESFGSTGWSNFVAGTAITTIVTNDYAISPDGTQNAQRIQFNLGGGTTTTDRAVIRQSIASQTDWILSVYMKSTNGGEQKILWHVGGDANETVVTGEWKRYTFNRNGVTNSWAGLALRGSVSSVDTADILVYGFQAEQGSYATSYIPTQGSAVTRLADSCNQTPPDGVIGQTEGTLYAEIDFKSKPEAGSPIVGIMTLNNNVNNLQNCIILGIERQSGGINRFYPFVQVGNSTVANIIGSTLTDGVYKAAFAYKLNDFVLYVNGVQIGTDSSGAVPTTSQFLVGERFNSDTFKIADGIKETKLYNTRLSNSELQVLTS